MTTALISLTRQKSTLLASRYPALAAPQGSHPTPWLPPNHSGTGNLPGLPAAKQLPGRGCEHLLTGESWFWQSHASCGGLYHTGAAVHPPGTVTSSCTQGTLAQGIGVCPCLHLKLASSCTGGSSAVDTAAKGQTASPQPLHLPFILPGSGAIPAGCHHSPWPQQPGVNG